VSAGKRESSTTDKSHSGSAGTGGYPEDTPRRNDRRDLPDARTPHQHQNRPDKKPAPSR